MYNFSASLHCQALVKDFPDKLIVQLLWMMFWLGGKCGNRVVSVFLCLRHPFGDGAGRNPDVSCDLPDTPAPSDKICRIHSDLGQMRICCVCHVLHCISWGVSKLLNHYVPLDKKTRSDRLD